MHPVTRSQADSPRCLDVAIALFEGFEVLDVFGPVELFSQVPDYFSMSFVAPEEGPVTSSQRVQVIAEKALDSSDNPDVLFIPGGKGTRTLVNDRVFLDHLHRLGSQAEHVLTVCTGSALAAAAGLLDGRDATSNKLAFGWATAQGPNVNWQSQARWVEDSKVWTSSGVAAGMDMAHAFVSHVAGNTVARDAANRVELEVHTDPSWDPFAQLHGLGPRHA